MSKKGCPVSVRTEQRQRQMRRERFTENPGVHGSQSQSNDLSDPDGCSLVRPTSPQTLSMGSSMPGDGEIGFEMVLPLELCPWFLWA